MDLLVVQGTLKSLLQHHSSKASILLHSTFFMIQLSHPGKSIPLTRGTFVDKVMSLRFNMLSRFVIAFLPRSKHLLISWLQSPSPVILEPLKIKSDTVSYTKTCIWIFIAVCSIKDINGMDLREAEDIRKRWQEYTEELYKKDLHDPDNHDGVITHLEPGILECEVKWALGKITMHKANGGDGIPVELFHIL